jgi:Gar1/Naf1 RNA binding region
VDEILGPINQVYFTIKPQEGIQATSFKSGDKFYIGGDKLLPLEKYVCVTAIKGLSAEQRDQVSAKTKASTRYTLFPHFATFSD